MLPKIPIHLSPPPAVACRVSDTHSECSLFSNHRKKTIFFILSFLIFSFLFTSCDFWNEPVHDYFEKWTSEVSIAKFEVYDAGSYTDKDGNLCIGSEASATLTLYMINPYHYNYAVEYLDKIPAYQDDAAVQITADPNDTTILHLNYPVTFLQEHDAGSEIGSTISLEHPINGTSSDFTFTLKCNSKPPVTDAALMTQTEGDTQTYVLAFYEPENCSTIHRDIVSVTINGTVYPLTVAGDGTMIFEDSKFTRTRPASLALINRKFNHSNKAVYFLTGEQIIEGNKVYTIGFTDSAGLNSFAAVDASLPRISVPTVTDSSGAPLSVDEQTTIKLPEGESSINVKIKVPTTDEIDETLEGNGDTTIKWEIYKGNVKVEPQEGETNSSPSDKEISLGKGDYTLSVWACRAGYKDSEKVNYKIRVMSNHIYVKGTGEGGGDDINGDGTKDSPYATILKAAEDIYLYNLPSEQYTIHILGTVTGSQNILSTIDSKAQKIYLKGEEDVALDGENTAAPLKVFTTVPVEITNLKIQNGKADEGGGLCILTGSNVTLGSGVEICNNEATNNGGGVFVGGGILTIKDGCSINKNKANKGGGIYKTLGGYVKIDGGIIGGNSTDRGNTANSGGGIYIDNGTVYFNGGTIENNKAASMGGGVYNKSTLTVEGGILKGNSVTDSTGKGGGIYAVNNINISGSPDFNAGSSSEKNNDVYLTNGKYINITGAVTSSSVAKITPSVWKRGTQVLSTSAVLNKFGLTKDDWSIVEDQAKGKIDAPLYVREDGDDTNNTGTQTSPYKTIKKASEELWSSTKDFTINIVGEVKGAQEITSGITSSKAKSIKIVGNGSSSKLNAQGSSANRKTTLSIGTGVPVTITDLEITGGYNTNGGGLYIGSYAAVNLGSGVKITGNQAVQNGYSGGKGGGVYVAANGKLALYDSALIGKSAMSVASDYSNGNKAVNGGGIYNIGTVYLGYKFDNASVATPQNLTGGIKQNYAGTSGGGIHNKGTLYMQSGTISYNASNTDSSTRGFGGGIFIDSSSTYSMSGGTISDNTAYYGGGIAISTEVTDITLQGGSITTNTATGEGGAVYTANTFTLKDSISIPCTGTKNQNDICLAPVSITASVQILSDTLSGEGNIWLCGNNKFYTDNYAALTGSTNNIGKNFTKFFVIGQPSQDWTVDYSGKLKKAKIITASNIDSLSLTSGFVYNFVMSSDIDAESFNKFIRKVYSTYDGNITIGEGSVLDLSRLPPSITSLNWYGQVGDISGDYLQNNISTIIWPSKTPSLHIFWTMQYALGNLKEFIVPLDSEYYSSQDGVLYNKDKTELIRYPPNKSNVSFTIPSTVQRIARYAFYEAKNLRSVSIPSSVTHIEQLAFSNSALTSVNIPGTVQELDSTFINCTSLETVILNTGLKYIGTEYQAEVFENCTALKSINIPNTVERIGRASFSGCINSTLTISVPSSVKFLGENVFQDCSALDLNNMTKNGWKKANGEEVSYSDLNINFFKDGSVKITRD